MATNKPLPKKVLERMTERASLLYAEMRARSGWEACSPKERNRRFSEMLTRVVREYKVPRDEFGLYKSTLGSWLQKRGAKRRAFLVEEKKHYTVYKDEPCECEDIAYPCIDYIAEKED